jgi:hypothetical protein
MNEIKQGINELASTRNDLMEAVQNRFSYVFDASDKIIFPYCVFSFQPMVGSKTSESKFEDFICQFSVYDDNESSKDGCNIIGIVKDIFDNCENSLNISGYHVLSFKYLIQRETYDSVLKIWTSIIQFKVKLQKGV